jgi:hypothetical protein
MQDFTDRDLYYKVNSIPVGPVGSHRPRPGPSDRVIFREGRSVRLRPAAG